MNTVSIVIPSWNAKVHLLACLSSIASFPPRATVEIIVVDNASTDGSPEAVARLYPAVRLIRNASNVGFAPAANQGLREATGSYLFLVNSDVVVTEGSFDVLMKFLDSTPRVALAGPLVCRPDGSIQENSRRRLPTLRRDFLQALGLQHISARCRDTYSETGPTSNVEMLDGCFWAMRRSSLEAIGFLDGSFPFMGEDMDWCRRCRGAGWYVAFVPEALVVHTGGASSASAPPMKFVLQGFRARQMYFLKHGGRSAYWVCRLTQTLLEVRRLMAWVCLLPFWRGHRAELGRNVQRDWSALKWLLQRGRAELAAWE